jgi:hypothetical protein
MSSLASDKKSLADKGRDARIDGSNADRRAEIERGLYEIDLAEAGLAFRKMPNGSGHGMGSGELVWAKAARLFRDEYVGRRQGFKQP